MSGLGKRIIILGGGLSGLSFAHYLRNFLNYHGKTSLVKKIIILEANDYMGGSVKSNVFEDNLVHELGPRSIRASGPKAQNTAVLMEQLGLTDRVMTIDVKSTEAGRRYVYRDNKMWSVPNSVFEAFKKLPATDARLFRVVMKDIRNKISMDLSPYPNQDPPLYDFVKYRFGEEAAEAVLDPLLRGITAGDCRKWSTKGIFRDVLEKEQAYGGVMVGISKPAVTRLEPDELFANDCMESALLKDFQMKKVLSFNLKSGLQTLPDHLSNSLLNSNDDDVVAIYNRTKAISVNFCDGLSDGQSPCSVSVQTIEGDQVKIDADHIVASLPATDFTRILESDKSVIPEEQMHALGFIKQIEQAPVGCVTVEYRNVKLPDLVRSFGFLTHSKSGSRLLGIAFDSATFPVVDHDTGAFRMTCMMGGDWAEQVFGTTDMDRVTTSQLEQIALEEISSILKIQEEPFRTSAILWKSGICQYRPGHVNNLAQMRKLIKREEMPLTILGQSYDGVAVNDVIYSARIAANEFAKSL